MVYNESMNKIFELYKKYREIINYLIVGGIGFVLSIATFALFMSFNLGSVVSNVISWVIVVILMYILNRYCVFEKHATEKAGIIKEIVSFVMARIFTLVLETIVVWLGIDILGFNSGIGAVIVKSFGQVLVIVLNFVFSKLFIFKNSKDDTDKADAVGDDGRNRKTNNVVDKPRKRR